MNSYETMTRMKRDRLERELASLKRVQEYHGGEHPCSEGCVQRDRLAADIAAAEVLLETEAWCHFDTWDETEGRDHFCGRHSAPSVGQRVTGLDQVGAPPLCEGHGQYVVGYVSGAYDAAGRPDDFVIPNLDIFWNTMDCFVDGCEAKGQLVLSSYVGGDAADPSQVYKLACGHEVL